MIDPKYIDTLKKRASQSHVYKKYQSTGLDLAELLNDTAHKALYMKLAKKINNEVLLQIAKDVSQRTNIENKGGYFMRILKEKKLL